MALPQPRTFVRFAPGKVHRQQAVAVRVTDMIARDARWWDARMGPHHVRIAARADRLWSWVGLLPACHLIQLSKGRQCRPLVVWARADNGQFLRVGMSILIERYPNVDINAPGDANFVWFMSAADKDVLVRHFQMSNPPSLGRVLLDNAIVLSMGAGLLGRIGLHAAAAGGKNLLDVYARCGLLRLPAAAALPGAFKRRNDGRFFYADDSTADTLAQKLDSWR